MCAPFYDLAIPFSAHLINGDVVMIFTCASTLWYYCTAAIFFDMVLARFPFETRHHAAKSVKAQLISSGDVSFHQQNLSEPINPQNTHQDRKPDAQMD